MIRVLECLMEFLLRSEHLLLRLPLMSDFWSALPAFSTSQRYLLPSARWRSTKKSDSAPSARASIKGCPLLPFPSSVFCLSSITERHSGRSPRTEMSSTYLFGVLLPALPQKDIFRFVHRFARHGSWSWTDLTYLPFFLELVLVWCAPFGLL